MGYKREFLGTLCFLGLISILIFAILVVAKGWTLDTFKDIVSKHNKPYFYSHDRLSRKEKEGSLYSPYVIRPRETNKLIYPEGSNELYPLATSPWGKGEMGSPNATVEAKYYAQRPLLNPDQYYQLLGQLFEKMKRDPLPREIDPRLFIYQNQFCQTDISKKIVKFVMDRINRAKRSNRLYIDLAKKDTWGGERWTSLDPIVFAFTKTDPSKLTEQDQAKLANRSTEPQKLLVNFTLYNLLRSISTNISASVFSYRGKLYMGEIGITSKNPAIPKKHTELGGDQSPKPQWIYGNTIEHQIFDKYGTADKEGHYIQGGIPQEFESIVDEYPDANLPLLNYKQHPEACTGGTPCPTFPRTQTYGTKNLVADRSTITINTPSGEIDVNV